jgi:O-acetyl-ADP-ribose deacetylase (regulator of RNase III)
MKEINGDLIELAKEGNFDIITHGCNCQNTMNSGIAKQIKDEFPEAYARDCKTEKGDINKLGTYTAVWIKSPIYPMNFFLLNSYTQFKYGRDQVQLDYEALTLCLRKINYNYRGKKIGLPQIGAGLAGGDWNRIKLIIQNELKDMDVTIVYYNG